MRGRAVTSAAVVLSIAAGCGDSESATEEPANVSATSVATATVLENRSDHDLHLRPRHDPGGDVHDCTPDDRVGTPRPKTTSSSRRSKPC